MSRTATQLLTRARTRPETLNETCSRVAYVANSGFLKEGICVHAPIIKLALHCDLRLNNNLLGVYSKRLGSEPARKVFDEMTDRDVVSFTGLMSSYIRDGRYEHALDVFRDMVSSAPLPNAFTFSNVLRCCSAVGELDLGRGVHGCMIKYGLGSNPVLGSGLIDFYSKFDNVGAARKVFGCVKCSDVVSWTVMVSSLVQAGKWDQAVQMYLDMVKSGVAPNGFTFVKVLAAVGFLGLQYGKLVHAQLIVFGVELNLVVKTALVDMYSQCGRMEDAITVSNMTPERDVVLSGVIISGFVQGFRLKEAIIAFQEMEMSGISPSNLIFLSVLNGCSMGLSLDLGRQIHARLAMAGFEGDVPLGNALVDMYMKCSITVEDGLDAFREIKSQDVISWTTLLAGLTNHGFWKDSLSTYLEMRADGVRPNSYTLSTVLRACSFAKCLRETRELHAYATKTGALHDIVVCNALVDAYAGSGRVADAWHVLKSMTKRDAITYTCLATRLNELGRHDLALQMINQCIEDDVKMDAFILASFMSASAGLGAMETGRKLHGHSIKSGLGTQISVTNGLVDFYGKLGFLPEARKAFMEAANPDAVSWNCLISALASHALVSSALSAFDEMRMSGAKPDSVTFLLLLSTCSHGGLVDIGLEHFSSMRETHGIDPQLEHYVYLVDLLGKAGRLEEALEVVETMPFEPNSAIYKAMLISCQRHRNMRLGEDMARRGLELDPSDDTFRQLLANLYDSAGLPDLGRTARSLKKAEGEW